MGGVSAVGVYNQFVFVRKRFEAIFFLLTLALSSSLAVSLLSISGGVIAPLETYSF